MIDQKSIYFLVNESEYLIIFQTHAIGSGLMTVKMSASKRTVTEDRPMRPQRRPLFAPSDLGLG